MKKSGLADSPFFTQTNINVVDTKSSDPAEKNNRSSKPRNPKTKNDNHPDTVIPRYHDTTIPRYRDTKTPLYHDDIIELVRRGVKDFGKEAATHRFTISEKKAVSDIIYTYKSRNVRTSENEIARIAVNFVVEDFKENGESSVLDKVLKALNR